LNVHKICGKSLSSPWQFDISHTNKNKVIESGAISLVKLLFLELVGQYSLAPSGSIRGCTAMLESTTPVIRDSRKLEAIDSALEKIVGRSLRAAPAAEGPVLAWPVACGSAVAERTRALEFSKGVLAVEVPDAGWRAELQRLAPQYLAVINRYATKSVNRIEFVVRKPVAGD
jgi:hypothetical protein